MDAVQSTDVSSSSKTAVHSPTEDEQKQFFSSLASIPHAKPAILSLLSPYCESYVPSSLSPATLRSISESSGTTSIGHRYRYWCYTESSDLG